MGFKNSLTRLNTYDLDGLPDETGVAQQATFFDIVDRMESPRVMLRVGRHI